MSINKSGSFTIKASIYKGANPAITSQNPELCDPNQMIRVSLPTLKGTYKFKLKYAVLNTNKVSQQIASVAFPNDNLIQPQYFFVSPQVCSKATNENFVPILTTSQTFNGLILPGSLEHELVAQVDGYLLYNIVLGNPAYGLNQPYPAISPFDPYQAGLNLGSGVQPYYGVGVPASSAGPITIMSAILLFDWEDMN
jgi:hypothetical protein